MPQRGLLLWGPPGTGKSVVCKSLCSRAGFALNCKPLAAAEVNRSLQGQAEEVLTRLFERARLVPHLPCAILIDEIDAMAPNRMDSKKADDSKVRCHRSLERC